MRRLLVAALLAVLAAGCAPTDDGDGLPRVGPADIDVDTPALREARERAGVEPCRPGDAEPVEGGLPPVTLPCFGGGPDVDLSRLRGPLVINYWAQNCTPCRTEMPILQSFHERYGDRVGVLGIDFQDTRPEWAMELVEETGVTYPLLADPEAATSAADPITLIRGLPMFVFVDADGRVAEQMYVPLKSEQQLVDLVAEHLGVRL